MVIQKMSQEQLLSFEPMLEMATPDLYRRNIFRVLGVPVHASARDVHRIQRRREMTLRLGGNGSETHNGPLGLVPSPSEDEVREALERLSRPVDRVLNELFWFWPTNGDASKDEALKALDSGDVSRALEVWNQLEPTSRAGQIATHNVAVLHHLQALDSEAGFANKRIKMGGHLDEAWSLGVSRWKDVLEGDGFWDAVRDRVRDLGDRLVGEDFVRQARGSLPSALLLINARLASEAAERGEAATARRHLKLIRQCEFGSGLADNVLREAVKPYRNRLRNVVDKAKASWTDKPQQGDQYVRHLHEEAKGILATLEALLPEDDGSLNGLYDMVADAMLDGQIAFGNKTNNWQQSIHLLKMAQGLARGDIIKDRLVENIEILQKNAEEGNDWYSPSYWSLPSDVVSSLEEAHDKARAGDYEGALRLLLVLDSKLGSPLRRCVAFTLSQRAWQITNQAIGEFNKPTARMQMFLDTIQRLGSISIPHPEMYDWQLPPCPCCGRRSYTRWVNGQFQEQKFWMCDTCSSINDGEREKRKETLASRLSLALEHILLATEVDREDAGTRRDLDSLRKIASNVDVSLPTTKSLKSSLGERKNRGVETELNSGADLGTCHFCGTEAAHESCMITVPMCGALEEIRLLFGIGYEYQYGQVRVPRCRRCRDEQRDLPWRIERWHEERLAVCDEEQFPKEAEAVEATRKAAETAAAEVARLERELARTEQQAREEAEEVGTKCERCQSKEEWRNGLCHRCDRKILRVDGWSYGLILISLLPSVALLLLQAEFGMVTPLAEQLAWELGWTVNQAGGLIILLAGATSLGIALLTSTIVYVLHSRRVRAFTKRRLAYIEQRRARVYEVARERVRTARMAFESTKQAHEWPRRQHEAAKNALRAAQDAALAAYDQTYPRPTLSPGVRPESDFLQFPRIKDLVHDGWGFGNTIGNNGAAPARSPVDVVGLVSREPSLTKPKVVVPCPYCERKQRIPDEDEIIRVSCLCGKQFRCSQGRVLDSSEPSPVPQSRSREDVNGIPGSTSGRPSATRQHILQTVRKHRGEDMVTCPICATSVKCKNLLRHYDKNHPGAEAENLAPETPASPVPQSGGAPGRKSHMKVKVRVGDECPHGHGPLKMWDGKPRCWKCGYPAT